MRFNLRSRRCTAVRAREPRPPAQMCMVLQGHLQVSDAEVVRLSERRFL